MDKRTFYSQLRVARSYDDQRFGGPSGARVNQRELEIVRKLIPPAGPILDLACGTGRLAAQLAGAGREVTAVDSSEAMLRLATEKGVRRPVSADAFRLPFPPGAFQTVVSLRFAFHLAHLMPLLAEVRRLLAPGGTFVFDTYRWSPRALLAIGSRDWGGRVYAHRASAVRELLSEAGLEPQRSVACFLFSPYLYRKLPAEAAGFLERLEPLVPAWALARLFWQATAPQTARSVIRL